MKQKRTGHNDPLMKKAQAAAIVKRRIMGDSLDTIATNFQMSRDTVERRLRLAKRSGMLQDATEKVLEELIPLAHVAYIQALENGDVNAARDIFYGTGILSKNNKPQVAPAEQVEMTLAVYREQRKAAYIAPDHQTPDAAAALHAPPSLDAEILGEELGADDGGDGVSPDDAWEGPPSASDSPAHGDDEED